MLLQLESYRKEEEKLFVNVEIYKDDTQVYEKKMQIDINQAFQLISIPTDIKVEKGLYTLKTMIYLDEVIDRVLHNGFWGYDQELLESGSCVTCDEYYFYKDEKPMPIIGMTYMQPDVHRKFIHRPNVYLWNKDFKTMQEAGINMIRTGIWTSFKSIMPSDGFVSEEVLRVFDAMFLTAKKYDIPIVFKFFAFSPEMWSGINPYMDPKSLQAQKRYINAVVSRHRNSTGVMWDLINEPSVSNPKQLWRTRPNGDHYEVANWRTWLKEKHGTIEELQEKWNYSSDTISSFDSIDLPKEEDFGGNLTTLRHEIKIHDYYLFTQEAVDYTSNHPWWELDDLYWDTIFCKSPNKPNLSQETGIMNVNDPNGKGKLTEVSMRNLLERKYAFAFAGDNAGSVQWVWNINTHMDSLNESTIGVVRPDGGQKLESDISYDFGGFMKEVAYLFENRQNADVVVINPFANNFSPMDFSMASAKKVCQILGHDMSTSFNVYSDFYLDDLKAEKLILLPSPRTLTNKAFDKLLECAYKGSVLYMSGPFSYDEFWGKIPNRSKAVGIQTRLTSVYQEETVMINNQKYRATFRDLKKNWVDKETEEATNSNDLKVIEYGQGKIIWSPLPLEMNEQNQVIQKAYEYVTDLASVVPDFTWMMENHYGIFGKKLRFDKGNLFIFVSELGNHEEVEIKDNDHNTTYHFVLPAQRIMMFATDATGTIVKTYKDWKVENK
ncbi:MAG TPA: hypothetical protein GX707_09390 [Epulopiscium sp.]|nr:hypothetical protein [Candidatus Epulonipiscium sp.]